MMVRNMAMALRRQDWIAVAIEFLLVIAGVLLAFQITAWASERAARSDRAAASNRLLDEAEVTVAYFRGAVAKQQILIDDLDYALEHVQNRTTGSADQRRMTIGLQRILSAAPPSPPSSAYDDLVSSGKLGGIGDAQLRASIANYRGTLAYNGRVVDYLRQRMPDFADHDAFRYVFARSDRDRERLQVDFPALARDSLLQERLALVAHGQLNLLQVRQRTLKDASGMCVEIGRIANRPCNLNRPIQSFD